MMSENKMSANIRLIAMASVFLAVYLIPFDSARVSGSLHEGFMLLAEYARQHVLLCLVPAFFIAGAITVFLKKDSVIRHLGPKANKFVAYSVASVSGAILAVCSCTVLPIFKGIYKKGAGLGPAVSFLYSGPAINVLAVILTAKVLGLKLGIARGVGAISFAVIIGLLMHLIFRKEDKARRVDEGMFETIAEKPTRHLWQDVVYFFLMAGILVSMNWVQYGPDDFIYRFKWVITGVLAALLLAVLIVWFRKEELGEWVVSTRDFALQILPLLFIGVFIAGVLFGRPGHEALIPARWVASLVGGNSLGANFFASFAGALMYFATLTEVPILQGLISSGMGHGPALALLLAGPSLSLPSILVISGELGWKKTLVYVMLVVVMSTFAGLLYGSICR